VWSARGAEHVLTDTYVITAIPVTAEGLVRIMHIRVDAKYVWGLVDVAIINYVVCVRNVIIGRIVLMESFAHYAHHAEVVEVNVLTVVSVQRVVRAGAEVIVYI
jgi:hypothetical protein